MSGGKGFHREIEDVGGVDNCRCSSVHLRSDMKTACVDQVIVSDTNNATR